MEIKADNDGQKSRGVCIGSWNKEKINLKREDGIVSCHHDHVTIDVPGQNLSAQLALTTLAGAARLHGYALGHLDSILLPARCDFARKQRRSVPSSHCTLQHVRNFISTHSHSLQAATSTIIDTDARFSVLEQHEAFYTDNARRDISRRPFPTTSTTSNNRHSAAESEWLQEGQPLSAAQHLVGESTVSAFQQPARVDWRLRASSRIPRDTSSPHRKKYPIRIQPPFTPVLPGEPHHAAIQAYNEHFLDLLAAEEAVDEAELKERLSTWGMNRLREEGYCMTDLRAYWLKANQFGRPVASFDLGPGVTLPEHRFETGAQVLLSRVDPLQEDPITGSVISSTASQLRVCFSGQFDDLDDGLWRLDLGRINLVFERMRNAIASMNQDPQAIEELSHHSDRQLILQGTHLRDVLLRSFDPNSEQQSHERLEATPMGAFSDNMLIHSWAKRYACDNPLVMEGDPVLEGLNTSQLKAVAMMIGERISLIQGPPGTGKTKTIIETIKLLKEHFQVPHPILVCTFTNVAVDNLTEGFLRASMKPLRVSFGGHPRASILEHSLDYKLEKHPLHSKLAELVKEEEVVSQDFYDLEKRITKLARKIDGGKMSHGLEGRLKNMKMAALVLQRRQHVLKKRCYAIKQEMLKDVLEEADVICTTCVTSACNALNIADFPVVFLDEASMSTEPASLIPLMKGSRHVALIGDHKQLPPVIISPEAQSGGLGTSLFERLMTEGTIPSVMLNIQYRMHPSISKFPSLEFYNLSLEDGTVDELGNVSPLLLPPVSQHLPSNATGQRPSLIFLDHSGMESRKGRSRVNVTEANIVVSVVEDLLLQNPELRGADIGIIAPYVGQIAHLARMLTVDEVYKARFRETLGDFGLLQLSQIEVKTVDGFEGREKDIIIFSTVRNNTGGYIGFLADRRRLNVGLTRAKRGLFVIGNINTLKTCKTVGGEGQSSVTAGKGDISWRRYVSFLSEQGLVVRLSGDKLQRALYSNWNPVESRGLGVLKG